MKRTNSGTPILEVGDSIMCNGTKVTIAEITFQEYWGDNVSREHGFYTEFRDTNGRYHNWKQMYDGGYVISKGNEVIL